MINTQSDSTSLLKHTFTSDSTELQQPQSAQVVYLCKIKTNPINLMLSSTATGSKVRDTHWATVAQTAEEVHTGSVKMSENTAAQFEAGVCAPHFLWIWTHWFEQVCSARRGLQQQKASCSLAFSLTVILSHPQPDLTSGCSSKASTHWASEERSHKFL